MNIVLIAHDNRKELAMEFCIAYKSILQEQSLFATARTGTYISENAGLNIQKFSTGALGGEQQVKARIDLNEIDMLIYLRDPSLKDQDYDEHLLFRHCDINSIPFATNIATAEMLVKGLERGDLSWRESMRTTKYVHPTRPLRKKIRTRRSKISRDRAVE